VLVFGNDGFSSLSESIYRIKERKGKNVSFIKCIYYRFAVKRDAMLKTVLRMMSSTTALMIGDGCCTILADR